MHAGHALDAALNRPQGFAKGVLGSVVWRARSRATRASAWCSANGRIKRSWAFRNACSARASAAQVPANAVVFADIQRARG
jgi:hypothetical protein